MNKLVKKSQSLVETLKRFEDFVGTHSDISHKNELTVRKEAYTDTYKEYLEVQDKIEETDESKKQERIVVENKYYATLASILSVLENSNVRNSTNVLNDSVTSESKSIRLPHVQIPTFSGRVEEWHSFLDLFKSLIHDNATLSNVQNLYYLKGYLQGEPLNLVSELRLTSENYSAAWDILEERFGNEFVLVDTHISAILNAPNVIKGNAHNLREFLTSTRQHISSLRALKLPVDKWDVILVCILTKKLDYQTHKAYELEKAKTNLPTLKDFLDILERHCIALETVSSPTFINPNKTKQRTAMHNYTKQVDYKKCNYCLNKGHFIYVCTKFKELGIDQKREYVNKNGLCYNCLKSGHASAQCNSIPCKLCKKRHHSLLHIPTLTKNQLSDATTNVVVPDNAQVSPGNTQDNATALFTQNNTDSQILLATACVNMVAANGHFVRARALLDSGSQTSFITTKLFKQLKLPSYKQNIQILGLSANALQVDKVVDVTIQSCITSFNARLTCAVLDHITADLPQCRVDTSKVKFPAHVALADPEYHTAASIDLLIGADLFYNLILTETITMGTHMPTLQNTKLGYVVSGHAPTYHTHHVSRVLHSISAKNDISDLIERFWKLEEISSKSLGELTAASAQERLCEKLFVNGTFMSNNQYTVRLPFIQENARALLGDSFKSAVSRFYSLERRLLKNEQLYSNYKKFIQEYIDLGHAEYVENKSSNGYFLPHHPIIKENSPTTKLRVVFDASSKTTSGYSLNDILLTGPTVQPELFDILCRFRKYRFVVTADIEKMYRGVRVIEQDTELQQIVWRNNIDEPLRCIRLLTVTYGTSSAPYLATRCLIKLAHDEGDTYPLAARALLSDTYVDDILSGADSCQNLINVKNQLIKLLSLAGFKLHKWSSNHPAILQADKSASAMETNTNITDNELSIKTLGLSWNPSHDSFQFSSPQAAPLAACTKRSILSFISKIFDPLGLLGPVVIQGKLLLQQIWARQLKWDDSLPPDLVKEWQSFEKGFISMQPILVPRWLISEGFISSVELHAFSDASIKAYGTCVYLRVLYKNNTVSVRLVCAKSRVAPLKTVTLPRLELCGTVLMARLTRRLTDILSLDMAGVYLWTDSYIALSWIRSSPSRWNAFVANRVSEIQELTSKFHWLHVSSKDNPSDLISRGLKHQLLQDNTLWWNGPTWLSQIDTSFNLGERSSTEDNLPEKRKLVSHTSVEVTILTRFSSFTRMERTVSYCLRFINNTQPKNEKINGPLTISELRQSHDAIIRIVQCQSFSKEIALLSRKVELTKSAIQNLCPFVDKNGLLRINTRLDNARVSYDQRYPIILPQGHHVTNLIINKIHLSLLHAGPQMVLSQLRLRYWLTNGKRQIKKILNKCIICFRHRAKSSEQLMGSLPVERVSPARPFSRVGVDFGGPFMVRQSRLRKTLTTKSYIALFVCMVTKAIHIELVSTMSTEGFLLALKRFISRRGTPTIIFSDNGSNFVGANNHLRDLYKLLKTPSHMTRVCDESSTIGIKWHFIPPHSPHWGGIWESGIKAAKYHIKRVVGNLALTYEELATVLTQIEAILNSRPLCQVSDDPNDLTYLSPGHFLINAPLTSYPEHDLTTSAINRLSFWKQCILLQQQFWKRWRLEYLNQLQNRPKWFKSKPNIKENTLVLLKEDNVPPLEWPIARVVKAIPGRDGKVRVIEIRTKTGIYTRPITKLCVLPLE